MRRARIECFPLIEIPGYKLLRRLGQGGMAKVYLAVQLSLGREVALKILSSNLTQDADASERFLREARLAANLHHPLIVPIYDVGVHDDVAYIAMQFEPGGTASALAGNGDAGTALRIIRDIATALDYAHGKGVVHRDIKPDNILRRADGSCVLSDFGIARVIESQTVLTREGTSIGTPQYMSPEQLRGEKVDGKADLYSLGVVLYQLLTGKLPYAGSDGWAIGMQHINADIPRVPPALSYLQPLLDGLMAKTPDARPQTGAEVARRIDALQLGPTAATVPLAAMGAPRPVEPGKPRRVTRSKALAIGGLGLALIIGMIALRQFKHGQPAVTEPAIAHPIAARAPGESIAVLPFENLSPDKDNAYFASGIQDEILTRLAKIGALRVISRTSTLRYASRPDNLPQIAQQLVVANILEGSVQKAGDSVRINVQLIQANDDSHLWAETYDRKLDNIFGVESEVATAIADALNAKLSGAEKAELAREPTQNAAAYDAYLRGLALQDRAYAMLSNALSSIRAYEDAVRLDSNFALAWAQLSRQHSFVFILGEPTNSHRDAARSALANATRLSPSLAETRLADALYRYWVERDYVGAKTVLEAVRGQFPNNPTVPYTLAAIARRQGDWQRSRLLFAQAIDLDPQNTFLLVDAAFTDIAMRDTGLATKHLGRILDLSPKNAGAMAFQAFVFQMKGDIVGAQILLAGIQPEQGDANLVQAIATNAVLSRNYAPAIAVLKAQLDRPEKLGPLLGAFENLLGDLERHAGDGVAATNNYMKARTASLEMLRDQPDNASIVSNLSWAQAGLGEKVAALEQARRAVSLLPASKDALIGPVYEETVARIHARFGDIDDAITALQHLLRTSYGAPPVTSALLRIDPDWDNLRGDPRFKKMIVNPEAAQAKVKP